MKMAKKKKKKGNSCLLKDLKNTCFSEQDSLMFAYLSFLYLSLDISSHLLPDQLMRADILALLQVRKQNHKLYDFSLCFFIII